MKKLLVASLLCTASLAQAHDLWVTAPATLSPSETLKADLSYSHDFPYPDEIPADRLHIFEPLHITSPDGTRKDLVQQGKNYQYVSESQLTKGSYVLTANYRPTFWSEFADDKWAQGDLTKNPTAVACQQAQMFGKSIVVVDGGENLEAISRPIGQELEIVPLANPNSAKVGKLFPVRILFQGKPLADEIVTATADTIALMDEEATPRTADLLGQDRQGRQGEHHSAGGRFLEGQGQAQDAVCQPEAVPRELAQRHTGNADRHQTGGYQQAARARLRQPPRDRAMPPGPEHAGTACVPALLPFLGQHLSPLAETFLHSGNRAAPFGPALHSCRAEISHSLCKA